MGSFTSKQYWVSGSLDSENTFSYHLEKDFGGVYLEIWPACGFGQYCTNESEALKKAETESPCRVVRHKALVHNGRVIGCIQGTQHVIKE